MKNIYYYETTIGVIGIADNGNAITSISFKKDEVLHNFLERETELIKKAYKELTEFLLGERKEFDLPIEMEGTTFQKNVWNALLNIPYGETRSYKEIAEFIGNPKACRAVGMANNKNPIGIIVPCHRVIGSNGKLVGYNGGLDIKKKLLDIEIANR